MTMLQALRKATHESHEALDGLFGSLNLGEKDDFTRFLAAHYIGMRSLHPALRQFAHAELGVEAPDFPGMLRDDLSEASIHADELPRIAIEESLAPAAVAYVLCGSRLGLAMLKKRGYWRRDERESGYMEDTGGLDLWRLLLGWMKDRPADPPTLAALGASAVRSFDIFRQAFALSGATTMRPA